MDENKKKRIKKIAIISLFILGIILIFSGYYIYQMTYTDNDGEDLIDDSEEELLYTLDVYKNELGELCLEYNEDYCKDIALSIPTKKEGAKVLAFDKNNLFVLYLDNNNLKIYNRSLNESQGILLENNYKSYEMYLSNDQKYISGIVYTTTDDKKGYFNLSTGNKLYEGKYNNLFQIDDDYLTASDVNGSYLLNSNKEYEEFSYKEKTKEWESYEFETYKYNSKYYYILNYCDPSSCSVSKIYSNNKEVVVSKNIIEGHYSFNEENLYVVEDKVIKKYDFDGKLISTSKSYNDIKGLINNYVVYVNNNKLILENIETNDNKEITTWNNNYSYDTYTSGYYTRNMLDSMGEPAKIEGLYVVINYNSKESGNYGMEYCYTSDKEFKTYSITQEIGGRAKPVLYLYPKETLNVKVEFQHPEYLTTTYPKYENKWEVIAHPNGDLYDKNNKYYYALYWDEVRYNEVDFHEGFYVEKENAIDFLEEKLSFIGLNNKEKNEFIMYWLPILEQNEKSLVYFELTKEREHTNKLIITPNPDSILRVSIHIKKVNNKVNINEQNLESFTRYGFTVVEWGGMTY